MNKSINEISSELNVSVNSLKRIEKKIVLMEKQNYFQKEFSNNEMSNKIKKIIEEEVANDSK